MNPRIASIENLIATDPGGRNIFELVIADQLRLAAQSLRLAKRVTIVSGFYIPDAEAGETDGPPGAKVLGEALTALGVEVQYVTDERNVSIFRALGIEPVIDVEDYLDKAAPTHLVSIERVGRGVDGRYRNMRGIDISDVTAPLDEMFLEATRRGLTTIGIGDGGNEIGMGKVFVEALDAIVNAASMATVVATDFCIVAGVSNWGAYGLAGALSVLHGRDLLPTAEKVAHDLERIVNEGGAVDGVTHRPEPTTDGQDLSDSLRMLESIRRQIIPSPLESDRSLEVGVLGFGESGRAAAALLRQHRHRIRISDEGPITLEPGMEAVGVEVGGHTIDLLGQCDLVVASPGVRTDHPILNELHRRGIPVMSELELAFQLGAGKSDSDAGTMVAVTGTIGKRTTVELLQQILRGAGRAMTIGGNRGRPLSELFLARRAGESLAVAVSSFQLESVVHFRPDVAIVLNIDEAHLDRHRSVAEYVRIKSRIFMNQGPNDALILPFDDPRIRQLARKHRGRTFFVSVRQAVDRGAWLSGGKMSLNVDGTVEQLGTADPQFPENLLSSVVAARLIGLTREQVAGSIEQIDGGGDAT